MAINKHAKDLPPFYDFFNPVLKSLKDLNGKATRREIEKIVIKLMKLTEKEVAYTYDNNDKSIVLDRISWALTWLKKGDLLENITRGSWILKDKTQEEIDPIKFRNDYVKIMNKEKKNKIKKNDDIDIEEISIEENQDENLLKILIEMDEIGFERLSKELLEKMGVENVYNTKQTNDKGVDGYGILKLKDLISFKIAFQCKRYKGVITSPIIRDFRGSLTADTDKGILITTARFTPAALEEALDPSKGKTIDIIDNEKLIEKIKEHKIGVTTELANIIISIDNKYFENI